MIVDWNSQDFVLYEDVYFDAPNWGETASSDRLTFTVWNFPFAFRGSPEEDSLNRIFADHNACVDANDSEFLASLIEDYVNDVNPDDACCVLVCGNKVVQVSIDKNETFIDSYDVHLVFEKYVPALVEAIKLGQIKKIAIGEIKENTMVALYYPEVDKESGRAGCGKLRYAMVLPADIGLNLIDDDKVVVMKSTTKKYWKDAVSVTRENLKNTGNMRDADLFDGTSHLIPGRLCLVDKKLKVEPRGHIKTEGKRRQIRDAVTKFRGTREITRLSCDGIPDPNVLIEIAKGDKDMYESESISLGEFVKLEDKVLVVLFD